MYKCEIEMLHKLTQNSVPSVNTLKRSKLEHNTKFLATYFGHNMAAQNSLF